MISVNIVKNCKRYIELIEEYCGDIYVNSKDSTHWDSKVKLGVCNFGHCQLIFNACVYLRRLYTKLYPKLWISALEVRVNESPVDYCISFIGGFSFSIEESLKDVLDEVAEVAINIFKNLTDSLSFDELMKTLLKIFNDEQELYNVFRTDLTKKELMSCKIHYCGDKACQQTDGDNYNSRDESELHDDENKKYVYYPPMREYPALPDDHPYHPDNIRKHHMWGKLNKERE